MANENPRLRDLALSFPALLFAIAAPRPGVDAAAAKRAALLGARLKDIAALAQVPMWLRALPPEAFVEPLPLLPATTQFSVQVANHIPKRHGAMPSWLAAIAVALSLADEQHALWVAREFSSGPKQQDTGRGRRRRRCAKGSQYTSLRRFCVWAWFSTHVPAAVPEELRWSAAMQLRGAESATYRWLNHIDRRLAMGDGPIDDTWLEPATVEGFDFVALRTARDLEEEAAAMRNCVGDYAYSVAEARSRLWSVRRNGVREATLELSYAYGDPIPSIYQLGEVENKTVSREVSLAARRWVQQHDHVLRERTFPDSNVEPRVDIWRAQWRPYWIARQRIPRCLPLTPARATIWNI